MEEKNSNEQPRQPKDLEGLLKFCIQSTLSENVQNESANNEQLSPERLKWLQEAIKGMTVDVVEVLLKSLQILSRTCIYNTKASENEMKEAECAFETILEWIGSIDMGNNFHKIGGSDVMKRCIISSPHSMVKWKAADIIAELSQNNPICQEHFTKNGFIPLMLNLLDKASVEGTNLEEMCKLKAIYAISSIVRQNIPGIELFISLNGPKIIVECAILPNLESKRLLIKACFFIASICSQSKDATRAFSEVGLTRQLIILLIRERKPEANEYIAKALLCLMSEKSNETEWRDFEDDLKSYIEIRKNVLSGKQEYEEELSYYHEIEKIMKSRSVDLSQKCVAS